MLMTKFFYKIEIDNRGAVITVTRKSDGTTAKFFNAGHTDAKNLDYFMRSVTDDGAASYFGKNR